MGSSINTASPQSACSAWLFIPAVAMYGLLVVFTFVGKSAGDKNLCKCFSKKLSNGGGSSITLATMNSTVQTFPEFFQILGHSYAELFQEESGASVVTPLAK